MSGSITIHLTDPTSQPFEVRDFTTDSSKHPLTTMPDPSAVQTTTSLYIAGKGVTRYGERIFENMAQMLENYSSSSKPQNPIIGQLWHSRDQYLIGQSDTLWVWDFATETWNNNGLVDSNTLPFWFNGSSLFYRSADTSHPLSGFDVECEHVYEPSIVNPNSANITPTHKFKVYNGNNSWKLINEISVNNTTPYNPYTGQLWFDTTDSYLKIYNGTSWDKAISDYLPLSGGTLTGPVNFQSNVSFGSGITINCNNNRITNVADPLNPGDVATRQWVVTYVTTGSEYLSLGELGDVSITSPNSSQYLRYDGIEWKNANLSLVDLGVLTATTTEIDYLTGVSSSIQSQLNNKFSLSSNNALSTPGLILDFNTNRLRNITTDPGSMTDASSVGYVNTNFFPLSGGTVNGSIYTGSLTTSVDVVGGGIAVNQGTNNGISLSARNQNLVNLPFGTPFSTSTKTYFSIKEYDNVTGGTDLSGYAGDDTPAVPTTGLALNGYVVTPGTANSHSGCVKINAAKYDNINDTVDLIDTNDNILTVENNNNVRFLIKGDGTVQILGDLVVSGSTTITSIDGGSF